MKKCLPDFSEANWTSCLRHFAGLSKSEEGESDFYYEGDMKAFRDVFNLENDIDWKKVYIEVKSTATEAKDFKLSGRQFQMV